MRGGTAGEAPRSEFAAGQTSGTCPPYSRPRSGPRPRVACRSRRHRPARGRRSEFPHGPRPTSQGPAGLDWFGSRSPVTSLPPHGRQDREEALEVCGFELLQFTSGKLQPVVMRVGRLGALASEPGDALGVVCFGHIDEWHLDLAKTIDHFTFDYVSWFSEESIVFWASF